MKIFLWIVLYFWNDKKHTAGAKRSRSIWILCYDLMVLWPAKNEIKSHPRASGSEQIWIKSLKWGTSCCCRSHICKVAKFAIIKMLRHFGFEATFFAKSLLWIWSSGDLGSNPGHCKLWGPLILKHFGLQGQKLIFLKDLIYSY